MQPPNRLRYLNASWLFSTAKVSIPNAALLIGAETLPQYLEVAISAEASRPSIQVSNAKVYLGVVEGMAKNYGGVSALSRV